MEMAIAYSIGIFGAAYFFYLPINFFFPNLFAPKVKCHTCGNISKAKMKMAGSGVLEILFLILGIIPGVIYYFWRVKNKTPICPKCNADKGIENLAA